MQQTASQDEDAFAYCFEGASSDDYYYDTESTAAPQSATSSTSWVLSGDDPQDIGTSPESYSSSAAWEDWAHEANYSGSDEDSSSSSCSAPAFQGVGGFQDRFGPDIVSEVRAFSHQGSSPSSFSGASARDQVPLGGAEAVQGLLGDLVGYRHNSEKRELGKLCRNCA
eukprot:COSAG02_NODE_5709_length_4104_cov_1.876654_2_plen_168_part_00